jgi:hypothetical protein
MKLATCALVLVCVAAVYGDVYMHNMRGSNNRLNENNQNRNNANRLFDSQNNNRGGYNVGDTDTAQNGQGVMEYYSTSVLSIEWTNQHGANNPNVNTEIVLQYMCNDVTGMYNNANLRDGTSTNRVDGDNTASGRHETLQYYTDCETRERNMGLFLADQELDGDTAIYTRQNTNGNRHGYECPEERDYYPYWHPTPWKDIAVLTSEPSRCALYQAESENVKPKNYCSDPMYNHEASCTTNGGTWMESPMHNIAAPECKELGWSRDNHLGNTIGGENLVFNWTIPQIAAVGGAAPDCVLRMRYNISTDDYDAWDPAVNAGLNGPDLSPIQDNPTVNFGEGEQVVSVKLALNTDQYGRTFQDRSHKFRVLPRPSQAAPGSTIYNLNVRGRRGNIVQTYPSVEYDFVPSRLEVLATDWVHIQWTGSLNTPDGAGQGQGSTDRSNIVQSMSAGHNYPIPFADQNMASATPVNPMFDADTAMAFATVMPRGGNYANVDDELDNRPAYYNGGLVQPGQGVPGVYYYICTRNNNFTNRSHKGILVVR